MSEISAVLPVGALLNGDGTVTYALQFPLKYKSGQEDRGVDIVTVRRKTMADNLALKSINNEIDYAFTLIQRLCELEPATVKMMDDVDWAAIGVIVDSFTTPGQRTGSSSPE